MGCECGEACQQVIFWLEECYCSWTIAFNVVDGTAFVIPESKSAEHIVIPQRPLAPGFVVSNSLLYVMSLWLRWCCVTDRDSRLAVQRVQLMRLSLSSVVGQRGSYTILASLKCIKLNIQLVT